MLALDQPSMLSIQEEFPKVVDFLLRYAQGQEYTENELQSIISFPQLASEPIVESSFLENHIKFVKFSCVREFEKFTDQDSIEDRLKRIFGLWKTVVLPDNIAELGILSIEAQELLTVVFATIVRFFLDIPNFVSWLSREENVHYVQEVSTIGLDEETNAVLARVIPLKIEDYIVSTWRHTYRADTPQLVDQWVDTTLIPELEHILAVQHDAYRRSHIPINRIKELATTSLARLRINELFDIVKHKHTMGLDDLAQALTNRPDLRDETVQAFTQQCNDRLLNGASDTVEIIQMLLDTVQAFSVLDPKGVLLEKVSKPIRALLKERADTSKKLAEGLFGDTNSPLSFLCDDLKKQAKPQRKSSVLHSYDSWEPDPIDTPVDFVRKQTQDSVSTLTDLYDNKEVFIKQFVHLFSAELLNKRFHRESSISRLNDLFALLSARFGASNVEKIAVMLEDIRRSDYINRQIQQNIGGVASKNMAQMSPLILSRLYWPKLSSAETYKTKDPLMLPARLRLLLDKYVESFKTHPEFGNLDLHWLPDQDRIRVELTLADRTLDLVVKPYEAMLISAFSGDYDDNQSEEMSEASSNGVGAASSTSPSLTLAELSDKTGLDEPKLLSAIQFWVDQGVLGTDGENYKVLEFIEEVEEQKKKPNQVVASINLAPSTSASAKPAKDPFEEMHVYWSYIVGMLTNLGSLPLEKIHSFLVMFVPNEDPYVKTKQELEAYLLAMVDENKLKQEDGNFSLIKV